jgi:TRAP-type uncharacterized transport system substrate-binding protein
MRATTINRGLAALLVTLAAAVTVSAQAPSRAPTAVASGEGEKVTKINNWTVGLAGGLPEGSATGNVTDLLYLKGVDVAITHADVFEHFRSVEKIPNIDKRVSFISEMYISELHVLVRPEIRSLRDLEGKKVSFHTPGAGPSVTAPILFSRLGIKVEPVWVNNGIAVEKMKTGELFGLIHTVGKPNNLIVKVPGDQGFKLLPVPYDKFDDYYAPSYFTSEDYPNLVKQGEKVETLGVPAVLAVYNWPKESDRYRRVVRFIDYYFDRFEGFHKPPYHPKWKSINLSAKVPGWTRYGPAEEKLRARAAAMAHIDPQLARQQAARAAPHSVPEQERLFQQFLEWSKTQGRR